MKPSRPARWRQCGLRSRPSPRFARNSICECICWQNRTVPGPHIPTPRDQLGPRPFSFYPPIGGTQHNEWALQSASAEEIQVRNTKTWQYLWIPRRLVRGVSSIEEPVVIVGLLKDLEYREGAVVPMVHRVIQMPRAVNDVPWRAPEPTTNGHLAPVVGIRLAAEPGAGKDRSWLARIAAGVLTCVVGLVVYRESPLGPRAGFFTVPSRVVLPFNADDDYLSLISRLGRPAVESVRRAPAQGLGFYLLRYPERGFTLVLAGATRDDARYTGALGPGGRVIHSVRLRDGRDSTAAMAGLRR